MSTSRVGFVRKVLIWSICGITPAFFAGLVQAQTPAEGTAVIKPVNTSRLLGGATVRVLDGSTGVLTPISGMTALIDDDASSGWTPPVGRTVLVISLAVETDVSSFTLFAPGAKGSYSVSVASSLEAALNPQSRTEVVQATFDKDTAQPVSNVPARFVVLELNVEESAPIRSVDVVGRPKGNAASPFTVVVPDSSREQNAGKADGKLVEVNFAADALGAKVINGETSQFGPMIDGDTGTTSTLSSVGGAPASASIVLAAAVSVDRVSLAFEPAEGTVTFLATSAESPNGRVIGEVTLDGGSKTLTLETPGVSAESITVVWAPKDGVTPLVVSEVGAFALARVERAPPAPDGTLPPLLRLEPPVVMPGDPGTKGPSTPVPPPILPPSRPVSR